MFTDPKVVRFVARRRVETEVDRIEASASPDEIRTNLIKFYELVAPARLRTTDGEDPPFLEEILTWTFRFGLPALANNLRVKYLGYEDLDEYEEEEEEGQQGIQEEGTYDQEEDDEEGPIGGSQLRQSAGKAPPVAPPRVRAPQLGAAQTTLPGGESLDDATDDVLGKKIKVRKPKELMVEDVGVWIEGFDKFMRLTGILSALQPCSGGERS